MHVETLWIRPWRIMHVETLWIRPWLINPLDPAGDTVSGIAHHMFSVPLGFPLDPPLAYYAGMSLCPDQMSDADQP